jgi:hypothetical protein
MWSIGVVQVVSKCASVSANDFIIVLMAAKTPTMMAEETTIPLSLLMTSDVLI